VARRRGPFRRAPEGSLVVDLDAEELGVLAGLAGELRALLERPDTGDPAIARLFPRAYSDPTEDEAEQEWQALMGAELLRDRLDALDALLASAGAATSTPGRARGVRLDDGGVTAWLRVLNDMRLVLGARLGVTAGLDAHEIAERAAAAGDDPRARLALLYDWLTYLEAELVELLLGELPG
jgi:hypothetical protein